jgi:DNA-binding beta-propeller fold protein YncE
MSRLLPVALLALGACGDPCDDPGVVCTIAGDGRAGFNGEGLKASKSQLYYPTDVAAEPGTERMFIDDWNNEIIRAIDADGRMVTMVGAEEPGDGDNLHLDRTEEGAPGRTVSLNHPLRLAFAPDGVLMIAAWHNHKLRSWDPVSDRVRIVVADSDPDQGTGANAGFEGDGGPAEDALVWFPSSVTYDDDGTYYFVDQKNGRIRHVDNEGIINTVAGGGGYDFLDGSLATAAFRFPDDPTIGQPKPGGALVSDGNGLLFVADTYNNAIRRVDLAADEVTTLSTEVTTPVDVELGPDGRLYVAEVLGHVVSAIDLATGAREVVAGTGTSGPGLDEVDATGSALDHPYGIGFGPDGALWIADTYNSKIRRIAP